MSQPLFGTKSQPGASVQSPQTGAPDANLIKETTTASFAADVIEASQTRPVIVDFWAPWCGPCKQLGPVLEKLVMGVKGAVALVKMNIDAYPEVARQLRVQSIPAVFAFKNGEPVDGFIGALPESQLRQFIERLIGNQGPSPLDELLEVAKAAYEAGDLGQAAQTFGEILRQDPSDLRAIAGLARCYAANRDLTRARQTLDMAGPQGANHAEIASARAAIDLAEQISSLGDKNGLEKKVAENPDDHQARFDLALSLAGQGKREKAADLLLDIMRKQRSWNDDGARKQLVQFFDAWGAQDPVTQAARRKLSSLLFS